MARTRYITLVQLAEDLGVSDRTVRRWVASGRLKAVRLSERCIRVDLAEVDRFLADASA